jgi:DNA-binding response OmpR family regulator
VSPSGRKPTILVVEDDPDLRSFYRLALTTAGYQVVPVPDGVDALRFTETYLPDLVILDISLPRLSGRDVLQELKASPDTNHIPVLIVTGTDMHDLAPGDFACILPKPVTADTLLRAVRQCLVREARQA